VSSLTTAEMQEIDRTLRLFLDLGWGSLTFGIADQAASGIAS
jgi:hypothetical protein